MSDNTNPAQAVADAVADGVRTVVTVITGWLKLFATLALALVVLSTFVAMFGHSLPYIPKFNGLQEAGIFTACVAYWLR